MISVQALTKQWPHVPLGDAVEFLDSMRRPVTAKDRRSGPYPYYGANGRQDSIDQWIFDEPLILLAEDGGHFEDPGRGVAYGVTGKCWVNNHAHVLRPKAGFHWGYLKWHLAHYDLAPFITGSTRAKLTKGDAERVVIVRPPLPDQRRIADILDKADAVRHKRKEAVALTEELLRSAFLEMFGDPVTNPKGWPVKLLGELAADMKYGTSEKCVVEHNGDALPVLRIPNVVGGTVVWDDLKYACLDKGEEARLRLGTGDMLFVRSNGNPDFIGRCAVFLDRREALFASYLIRVRLQPDAGCLPEFVQAALEAPSYRHVLTAAARTTAGNYNVSTEGLRRLRIPVPPADRQATYLNLRTRVTGLKGSLHAGCSTSDTLFDSLVQRLFRGELMVGKSKTQRGLFVDRTRHVRT